MDCFTNLIGIDGKCSADTPESVYNLNDLSGISLFNVESAIDSEPDTAISFLTRLKDVIAPQFIIDEIRNKVQPKYEIKSIIESEVLGIYKDNLPTQAAQAYNVGLNVAVDIQPYLAFDLTRIGLQVQSSGVVNVKVIDLISNTTLDTIPVTAVANVPTWVDVSKTYYTRKQKLNLLIAYDATTLGGYETKLTGKVCSGCQTSYKRGSYVKFKGAKLPTGSTAIKDNLEALTGTAGLSITYSLRCAVEPFICNIRSALATSVLFKVGELVMREMQAPNNRLNSVVSVYGAEFQELEEYYKTEYEKSLSNVLEHLHLPKTECFKCKQRTRFEVVIP